VSKRQGPRIVDLEIESLGADGFGVAQFERRPVHVKGALPGEVVSARVVRRRRGSWYALPEQWLVTAGSHAMPACEAFMRCGGCSMQHLTIAGQLDLKQRWLIDQLDAAAVVARSILPPVRGPQYYYRRRARLAVRSVRDTGELLVGFRESFGNRVARLKSCCVLTQPFSNELPALADLIAGLDARETIPQIEVASGDDAAALIIRHVEPLSAADRRAIEAYQRGTSIRVLSQPEGYDSIVDLTGAPAALLSYRLDGFGVSLQFHPADFVQVNASVNADLVSTAIDWLDVKAGDRVVDLFCGIGNFTLPLARRGATVLGLEGADELVRRGRDNAQRNGVAPRVRFETADLYAQPLDGAVVSALDGVAKVLLDPPRTGAGAVLSALATSRVERIAYVSCHPVSFARDAAQLRKAGFALAKVRVFDMFPHTTHVETLGVFERSW
jgi:23S rRNA (uracil1939-C5)-methyltransferase